jgi:hypothetical protein
MEMIWCWFKGLQETETILLVSVCRTVSMMGFDKVWSQSVLYGMMKKAEKHCF